MQRRKETPRRKGNMADHRRNYAEFKPEGVGTMSWFAIEVIREKMDFYGAYAPFAAQLKELTTGQRAIYSTYWCRSEVFLGGFEGFFRSPTGMLAVEALEGYRRIGAKKCAQALDKAMKCFPAGKVPRERDQRMTALDQVANHPGTAQQFESFESEFIGAATSDESTDMLCDDYVKKHMKEFFVDAE